ncbi:MAG: CapA family protein [Bacteroidales bacterium]|nr:CapA family protein [Bacteroidales bacterium]
MKREIRDILLRVSIILTTFSCCHFSEAQEIRIPERWDFTDVPPVRGRDTLTVVVLGDVMMHSRQIDDARQEDGSYRFDCFRHIRGIIGAADIAIANMEFTLAGEPYSGYPAFSAPDSFAEYAADCGIDIFLTANNHILDKGSEGAARTLEIYGKLGIRHTGTSADQIQKDSIHPLMTDRKGFRSAIVNMTYGTNSGGTAAWPKVNYIGAEEDLGKAIAKASEMGAETIIAFPHWGNEYELRHSARQEKTAAWLAGKGVDIIIGAHPHVVQDFQKIGENSIPVAYSLGNAVSNMSAANTQIGLMATVRITRDDTGKATVLPIEFTYLWCSRPGGYTDTYMVLPVKDFIGTREEWTGGWEYDKMIDTYHNVISETGIRP